MSQTLNDFRSEINKRGLHSPNQFSIEIPRGANGALLQLFCESVSLPGTTISTFDYPLDFKGHDVKVPNGITLDDVTCVFALTNDFDIKKFFDKWHNEIITQKYLLNYDESFVEDIFITAYDRKNEPRYKVKLRAAWPITVAPIELGSASNDEYTKLQVTFTYNMLIPVV